ncbi:hypothetical protein [Rhizobium sp. 11515TR]|uniref:hypothetical protein n=1 Tax=Rhizobium sp. 11515TR TaxID=2028343 RepID=UPI000BA8C16D|nr:hypothetical protein [Rhizobium sp. 11515TR]ASW06249.1 hypothetical protein CKA34_10385 [Rhizobium sp. 11515TR]
MDIRKTAYNAGLSIRYVIAASKIDPIQHIPEVDAIIERRLIECRREALEEAAKIADDHAKSECSGMGSETEAMRLGARSISSAIRVLSESSPTLLQEQKDNGGKEGE